MLIYLTKNNDKMQADVQVGYLMKLASLVAQNENTTNKILHSYYLMRCRDVSTSYGLPEKYFSTNVRCSRCLSEWNKDTAVKIRPIRLGKRQRRRLRKEFSVKEKRKFEQSKIAHAISNEIEQVCSFCKNSLKIQLSKQLIHPKSTESTKQAVNVKCEINSGVASENKTNINEQCSSSKKHKLNQNVIKQNANVYSCTYDVFSLNNKNNQLKKTEETKPIKNNKRKKDKFAGLCKKAVEASAKIKEEKDKKSKDNNKISLFLKPSGS